ncbi:DNA cytosine methyltransferase [Thermomicrobium sp.]
MQDLSGLGSDVEPWMRWWRTYLRGGIANVGKSEFPVRIVDLFCGCGGFSLGAAEAARALGLLPVFEAAVDIDAAGLQVYSRNLQPVRTINRDVGTLIGYSVHRLARGEIPDRSSLLDPGLRSLAGRVDLLLAGPPCEGHSNLNNKTRRRDPRNTLVLDAVAVAIALEASTVVIENVPGARADERRVVQSAEEALKSAGYRVLSRVLDASDYAVAQTRRRLFIMASRLSEPCERMLAGLVKSPPPDVRWAIEDLEDAGESPLDIPTRHSAENERRIAYLFETHSYDLPDDLRPPCHRGGHTYPSVYGRLSWDKPAGTITTGFTSMGRGRFVHPSRPRTLTPHEAARLQGFPDSFRFVWEGDRVPARSQLAKWIGDAVPPPLAYAVVLTVLKTLLTR